ncbi:Amino acid transporter, transmembrane [Cynara cardunculus var. scolymus]|uniref:Amino acid transporter, transmembrane n=1 Tax=Cynara cardunculus var. scolymus TaxID=59895 RepID=A0A118K486_CYNCS|nr:Amino acid transporter, transmembrane [Cynara cardunculus var. scolymus]
MANQAKSVEPRAVETNLTTDKRLVAQMLLTLPYSFSKLGMTLGIVLQIFNGLLGSWTLFEVLDGLLGPYWRAIRLAFNCTFLLFGPVIQLIACARYDLLMVIYVENDSNIVHVVPPMSSFLHSTTTGFGLFLALA